MSVARSSTRKKTVVKKRAPGRAAAKEVAAGAPVADGALNDKVRFALGVVLVAAGLLLLASLFSYHPRDESVLQISGDGERRNWIGPVGAQLSALLLGLFGLAGFAVSAVAIWGGARRLGKTVREPVAGRGVGIGLVLLVLPLLLHVLIGDVGWRGEPLRSGGALGLMLGGGLEAKLGWLGAVLVLLAGLIVGVALAIQTSLEDVARDWWQVIRQRSASGRLAIERRRERRDREKSRKRVMEKHLERAEEKRGKPKVTASIIQQPDSLAPAEPAPPLRVVRRQGAGSFSFQKHAGSPAGGAEAFGNDVQPQSLDDVPLRSPSPQLPALAEANVVDEPARPSGAFLRGRAKKKPPQRAKPAAVPAPDPQPELFKASGDPYALPPVNLLSLEKTKQPISENDLVAMGEAIRERCAEFGVQGTVDGITPGPVITVFEFQPAPGVKVSQIVNLSDDLALALRAESIRIDRIPGRSTLGIEVPNENRAIIHLGPLLADGEFQKNSSPLTMALGSTLHGESYYVDLAKMPHLLVAGATGAGKSVGLQSMITSILYKANRDEVKFIFIDPKRIELGVYSDIPHLKTEVVVEPKKASNALRWAVSEMERRYRLLAEVHVRSIDFYNKAILDPEVQERISLKGEGEESTDFSDLKQLPYLVVIIDELADLMMVSSSEVEHSIARLAQMARAVGIHLIVATQRPSVDVLTGTIKANFPCRMAFATATRHDSRTILDQVGSEKLLGKGDMLFLPPGSARPIRLHGAYVSEQETAGLIRWLKRLGKPELDLDVVKAPKEDKGKSGGGGADDTDPLFDDAARLVVSEGMGSASFLQRRMRVGFSRAARLIDMLADDGILGPAQGSKPREVLVPANYFEEVDSAPRE